MLLPQIIGDPLAVLLTTNVSSLQWPTASTSCAVPVAAPVSAPAVPESVNVKGPPISNV